MLSPKIWKAKRRELSKMTLKALRTQTLRGMPKYNIIGKLRKDPLVAVAKGWNDQPELRWRRDKEAQAIFRMSTNA